MVEVVRLKLVTLPSAPYPHKQSVPFPRTSAQRQGANMDYCIQMSTMYG